MNLEQITEFSPQIKQLAKKFGIARVFVFGSVARGESTERSDVDFLVEMQEGASLFGAAGFGYEVENLLGVRVDVVPSAVLLGNKDQIFSVNIQREAIAI